MKPLKFPNLYSRLALITSVTLVVGYFIVYAAWSSLTVEEVGPGATITTGLMTKIKDNFDYLNTQVSNFSFSAGKIGIGTSGPVSNFEVWAWAQAGTAPVSVVSALLGDNWTYSDGILSVKNAGNRGNIGNVSGSPLFKASFTDATAMIIDKSGNVGIGTTTPGTRLSVIGAAGATAMSVGASANNWAETIYGSSVASQSYGTQISAGTNSTDYGLIVYNYAQTIPMLVVSGNGNVGIGTVASYKLQLSTDSAAKPTSNTWTIASDRRIKKDINNFTDGLDTILALQPRTYKYNGLGWVGYDDAETHIWIVAQEVEKVAPYMVETRTGTIDGKEMNDFKTYQWHALPFILVNAVKELKSQKDAEIGELKSQILELKNEIQELRNK